MQLVNLNNLELDVKTPEKETPEKVYLSKNLDAKYSNKSLSNSSGEKYTGTNEYLKHDSLKNGYFYNKSGPPRRHIESQRSLQR
jgi:hypothetical protein